MKVTIIAAIGKNYEIGKNNNLLWHLPMDMQFFKETTYWHHVIMGRKNYESIPPKYRPLVDRTNIIVSRNTEFEAPECFVVGSLSEALAIGQDYGEARTFIIGGAQIYKLALDEDVVDDMFITHVDAEFEDADTFFPRWKEDEWENKIIFEYQRDLANPHSFRIVHYRKKSKITDETAGIETNETEKSNAADSIRHMPGTGPVTDI